MLLLIIARRYFKCHICTITTSSRLSEKERERERQRQIEFFYSLFIVLHSTRRRHARKTNKNDKILYAVSIVNELCTQLDEEVYDVWNNFRHSKRNFRQIMKTHLIMQWNLMENCFWGLDNELFMSTINLRAILKPRRHGFIIGLSLIAIKEFQVDFYYRGKSLQENTSGSEMRKVFNSTKFKSNFTTEVCFLLHFPILAILLNSLVIMRFRWNIFSPS